MKKKLSVFLSLLLALSMILPMAVMPVFAEGDEASDAYEAPRSPAVTFNMNMDWKFYDTRDTSKTIQQLIDSTLDSSNRKFYDVNFDDSKWETVSIPHAPGGLKAFDAYNGDAGGGYRSVLFYRKTFTVPTLPEGGKVFFELEGIRQAAYVWVNGREVGYYEAGITAMGFDITNYVTSGEKAVIAICNDGTTARGTTTRIPNETVPGQIWGSSYSTDNYKTRVGDGVQYQWNTKDFNEPVIGLVYDAYLHITGSVYQTFPLYNNLKTTGNYIYAKDFDIRGKKAKIGVKAEIRNESGQDGAYKLEVVGVDHEGNKAFDFTSEAKTVTAAKDAVKTAYTTPYTTAVESNVYSTSKPSDNDYNAANANLDWDYTLTDKEQIEDATKRPQYASDGKKSRLTYSTYDADRTEVTGSLSLPAKDTESGNPYAYFFVNGGNKEVEINGKNKLDDGNTVATLADASVRYTRYTSVKVHDEVYVTKVNTPTVEYITAEADCENLRFWSLDDPYLYTVYTILKNSEGNVVDVQEKKTGFRKIAYDANNGILLNDSPVWLRGYAQRSTNEWAVIGVATDWLQDYDMKLLKENNSNFIRWMHVAPKPNEVRSSDKYGVAVVVPAGDKEDGVNGRQWTQRTEAMRDAIIYFRNSPSVFFWETGNNPVGLNVKADEMYKLRQALDPDGMRFIGARSTQTADQLDYDWNYAGTMYGNYSSGAINAMKSNDKMGPIMETEYARDESPRRVWDDYSPPDFDYINKWLVNTDKKQEGYDVWDLTQEEATVKNVKEYADNYYTKRMGSGNNVYSAAAMMVWSDSNMHTRNTGTENDRTSGRVDAVRQTKEMFEGTKTAQADDAEVHIIGHWSYPEADGVNNYKYFDKEKASAGSFQYWKYNTTSHFRDPQKKTVYVIGSARVSQVKLFQIDKQSDGTEKETPIGYADGSETAGVDKKADSNFVYQFDNVDVTKGDGVIARAYDAMGTELKDATHKIYRTGDAAGISYKVNQAPGGWRADGSDIAYIDIKIVDGNGNVCPTNYDKITFEEISGDGTFLGGYNSGSGTGEQLHSKYFDGKDKAVTTIGKTYMYAENGTARVFVRSKHLTGDEDGTFTFTISMNGLQSQTVTIHSTPVKIDNGVTTQKPAELNPNTKEDAGNVSGMPKLYPLMNNKWNVSWNESEKVTKEVYVDPNVYYDLQYNGVSLGLTGTDRARLGTADSIFGPIVPILAKLKESRLSFDYTYDDSNGILNITSDGHTYTITKGTNYIVTDNEFENRTELTQQVDIINGQMFVSLATALGYVSGDIGFESDHSAKTYNITYSAE